MLYGRKGCGRGDYKTLSTMVALRPKRDQRVTFLTKVGRSGRTTRVVTRCTSYRGAYTIRLRRLVDC